MHITQVMADASEIVHYDTVGVPLYINYMKLSNFQDMRALCHWHEDIEFIYVELGEMNYFINGKKLLLKEQDCLLINARQMHYACSIDRRECHFISILCHPGLLSQNLVLHQQLLKPVLENSRVEYLLFPAKDPLSEPIRKNLSQVMEVRRKGQIGYELEAIGFIGQIWCYLLRNYPVLPAGEPDRADTDLTVQRTMVSYIYQHFTEKISLEELAKAGNVCRSKCCSIFKRYLRQSPIDFLNHYRLEISRHLLTNTDYSITQIALSCGFSHPSYYSKLFVRVYGCTPGDYRKENPPSNSPPQTICQKRPHP